MIRQTAALLTLVCIVACNPLAPSRPAPDAKVQVTTPSGLGYAILAPGSASARVARAGDKVSVHYTGWLTNGKQFDSSLTFNRPFEFTIGGGEVIKGWEEGVAGMKVGEKRKLVIPSALGYGSAGSPPTIPANATLLFEVELLSIKS
jgi:FKBP-type peptidyl-prolyl cis-trans isomerase FkpA